MLILVLLLPVSLIAQPGGKKKDFHFQHHPGVYLQLPYGEVLSREFLDRVDPEVHQGVVVSYRWASLEPERGKYRPEAILRDLYLAGSQKVFLIARILDNGPTLQPSSLPVYHEEMNKEYESNSGIRFAKRWDSELHGRFLELLKSLGKSVGDHPRLEGIWLEETNLESPLPEDYRPAMYVLALNERAKVLRESFPDSRLFITYNGIPDAGDLLKGKFESALSQHSVVAVMPDIFIYPGSFYRDELHPWYRRRGRIAPVAVSVGMATYLHFSPDNKPVNAYEAVSFARKNFSPKDLFVQPAPSAASWDLVKELRPVLLQVPSLLPWKSRVGEREHDL